MNADIASGTELDRIGALYCVKRTVYQSDADYRRQIIFEIMTKKDDKMNDKKDYSMLRPFDLEAAKAGEPIIWGYSTAAVFLGESINKRNVGGRGEQFRIEHVSGLSYAYADDLKMAPLAWVEERPVYKGDVLYSRDIAGNVEKHVIHSANGSSLWSDNGKVPAFGITWQKPKVKKSGWRIVDKDSLKFSKEMAEEAAAEIANAVVVYGEWEE